MRNKKPQTQTDACPLLTVYQEMNEHCHQREFFSWIAASLNVGMDVATAWVSTHPTTTKRKPLKIKKDSIGEKRLIWIHSIPNGGSRGGTRAERARTGAVMRSEGVRRGIPDIYLPYPSNGSCGLYIELKKIGGKPSDEQIKFSEYCEQVGYKFKFCQGYWSAMLAVQEYLTP